MDYELERKDSGEQVEGVLITNADNIIALAEKAEQRIEAVKKIKNIALRVTNNKDWCDQNGKPYLEGSGSEKVARVFGISWRINPPTKQPFEDGHYKYNFIGQFSLSGATIEAIGSRSSKDAFFTTRYRDGKKITLTPSEVDESNVEKSAYTNCIGNGVTRLLGIRNLTWEELKQAGIDRFETSKVDYKKKVNSEIVKPIETWDNDSFYRTVIMYMDVLGKDQVVRVFDNHEIKIEKQGDIKRIDISLRQEIISELEEIKNKHE